MNTQNLSVYKGPNLGLLAVFFTLFFITGLSFVISSSTTTPHFPGPWETVETISAYFRNQSKDVLLCAFFQFISAIPLALFTASALNRLRALGLKSAWNYLALVGGIMTCVNLALAALILWVMAYPGIAQEGTLINALYYMVFAIGGVGYSVPMGLLIGGITLSTSIRKLLPAWLVWTGILLASIGVLSALSLVYSNLLLLIPLTRFPGFIWMIISGFKLSKSSERDSSGK